MTENMFNTQGSELLTIRADADLIRIIRWIKSATTDNKMNRPVLEHIEVKAPFMVSTDGFVIHRAKFSDPQKPLPIPDGLWEVLSISNGFVILREYKDGHFPDWNALMDGCPDKLKGKPKNFGDYYQVVLSVDPSLLKRALAIIPSKKRSCVTMIMAGGPIYIDFGNSIFDPGAELDALVMPMHNNYVDSKFILNGGGLALVPFAEAEVVS